MVVNGVKYLYTLTEQSVTFHGRVISVNDQPTVTSFRAYFPPIAYNTTTSPNDGFLVSDVTSKPAVPFGTKIPSYAKPKPLATDVEGDTLGLGVIVAPNSSIGAWFYKADGSSNWLRMDVSNALVNGKPSGNTSVFILPHNARSVASGFCERCSQISFIPSLLLMTDKPGRQVIKFSLPSTDSCIISTFGIRN